jgi:hypothetical protein
MRTIYFLAVFIIPCLLAGQGGLLIGSGANVVATGQPRIVVNNGKFSNDGDFAAGGSTVYITGSATTGFSTIGGASVTIFNQLEINKSSNDTRLDHDIEIDGDLTLKGGNLVLNHSDIMLGGNISGETANTRITGTDGGAIIKTVNLNMPIAENPGNLGVEITSIKNLGQTTIHRRHSQLTNNGNHSIYRHFDISPASNTELDATLRIHYFDEELAGLTENQFEIWRFDGANWSAQNTNSFNTTANWVEASGFSSFQTFTVAEEMNLILPVELVDFKVRANDRQEVDVFWSTASETNSDYFIVERSTDGLVFEAIARVKGAGNSTAALHYQALDDRPALGINYYRLRQVDFGGSFSYSDIETVHLLSGEKFSAYPNPLSEVLNISAEGLQQEGELGLEISDELGRKVFSKTVLPGDLDATLRIGEVSGFAPGNYFLSLRFRDETYSFSLVKMR